MKSNSLWKDRSGDVRLSWCCLIVLAVMLGLVGGICALANWSDRVGCRKTAQTMDRDYNYGWYSGCQVRGDDGKMYPVENVHVTVVR